MSVPRHYFKSSLPEKVELHVFVDASEDAFSAVSYWRSIKSDSEIEVTFITSKTKCAPLKSMTIPRLELQAADWKWLPTNLNVADETTRANRNIDFSLIPDGTKVHNFCISRRKIGPK